MNEVEAVKKREDIQLVGHLLEKHGSKDYRDIWELGINAALRISDLLNLRYDDVVGVEELTLIEGKTEKKRSIKLNSKAQAIIARRHEENPSDVWLFQAKGNRAKGARKPVDRSTVARKFKEIGDIIGIALGTHSMRKTRGYAMWSDGVPVEFICKVLNHSSPSVTLRYIGIEQDDIRKSYDDYVL
ncbi:tyrosine-type recombinase/integrase [Motiliproteus sp.]|uniref:tyrosine-type recombinase/integrase n=1 Tax=Motiliproteus sp. TaxID=1898955 RepID=UPI003BAD729C